MATIESFGVSSPRTRARPLAKRKLGLFVGMFLATPALALYGLSAGKSAAPSAVVRTAAASSAAAEANPFDHQGPIEGEEAKRVCLEMVLHGRKVLESIRDFQGIFYRQERISGVLQEQNEMQIKMRRLPTSVFMQWQDPFPGREMIWHEKSFDGKLLIHESGWKGRIVPLVKIDPDSPLVTSVSRRPIQEIGLWKMTEEILSRRQQLELPGMKVEMTDDKVIGERPCYCFTFTHPEKLPGVDFHLTILYIDKAIKIPVGCEIFDWPEEADPETPVLLESYLFKDLELNIGLADADFDPANPNYHYTSNRAVADGRNQAQ